MFDDGRVKGINRAQYVHRERAGPYIEQVNFSVVDVRIYQKVTVAYENSRSGGVV